MSKHKKYLALFLYLLNLSFSSASTISPKEPVHESITRAAKVCFDKAKESNTPIVKCPLHLLDDSHDVNMNWIMNAQDDYQNQWDRIWYSPLTIYPSLEKAVRWPDTPTSDINGVVTLKFGLKMLNHCKSVKKKTQGDKININSGLVCNSHYGDMQFFHSQASNINEPAIDTYNKIYAWAEFLFKVASSKLSDSELDQPYCKYFSGDTLFDKAMLPDSSSVPCEDIKDPKWHLTTLFTFNCPNLLSSKGCKEIISFEKYNKSRIYATGALLHLIQDSYSQSHAVRGTCEIKKDEVVAKTECLPIKAFTNFNGQKNHSDADRSPIFSPSCSSSANFDDSITASAKMLWHIDKKSTIDDFKQDFYRVFGTTLNILSARDSEKGQCFIKDLKPWWKVW